MKNRYLRELKQAEADYRKRVEALADKVRSEVVVPICEKKGLEFLSGNGTFAFFDAHDETIGSTDDRLIRKYGLVKVFRVLNAEVDGTTYLGDWVCDVRRTPKVNP